MGSNDLSEDEGPLHERYLLDFWISRFPTTVQQYGVFTAECGETRTLLAGEDHPMTHVSWEDSIRYCTWLNEKLVNFAKERKRNGDLFRGLESGKLHAILPSEAEWEKAARGTDGRIYPWGNEFDPQKLNIEETGIGTTSPVGGFPGGVSPFGIHDMAGNVWEWTRSISGKWDDEKGELTRKFNYPYLPQDGREELRKTVEFMRVIRGGSFAHDRTDTPCAYRGWDRMDHRCETIGFRVAITVIQE